MTRCVRHTTTTPLSCGSCRSHVDRGMRPGGGGLRLLPRFLLRIPAVPATTPTSSARRPLPATGSYTICREKHLHACRYQFILIHYYLVLPATTAFILYRSGLALDFTGLPTVRFVHHSLFPVLLFTCGSRQRRRLRGSCGSARSHLPVAFHFPYRFLPHLQPAWPYWFTPYSYPSAGTIFTCTPTARLPAFAACLVHARCTAHLLVHSACAVYFYHTCLPSTYHLLTGYTPHFCYLGIFVLPYPFCLPPPHRAHACAVCHYGYACHLSHHYPHTFTAFLSLRRHAFVAVHHLPARRILLSHITGFH